MRNVFRQIAALGSLIIAAASSAVLLAPVAIFFFGAFLWLILDEHADRVTPRRR